MQNNESKEVMHILTDGNPIAVYGEVDHVDVKKSDIARFVLNSSKRRTFTAIHNHPGGSGFSLNDLNFFMSTPSVKTLTIVTNQGKVMYMTKTKVFDERVASTAARGIDLKGENGIEEFLKLIYNKGIKSIVR
ncbi:hypothetical protein IU402_06420 [Aerococcaceae bacterium zg-BR9]|uniref:hypothetical protein n=1 Tax=Aerococcaceae bacterium zg-1292 TaxID=2774330 RepID=UPI0040647A2F|nr:hypothetical protein [Aerococcaceae bacterium zg-BR9]